MESNTKQTCLELITARRQAGRSTYRGGSWEMQAKKGQKTRSGDGIKGFSKWLTENELKTFSVVTISPLFQP